MDGRCNKGHRLKPIINQIILFAVTIVISVMINRKSGGGYRGRFDGSVSALYSSGVRFLARQEGGLGESEVVASDL